MQASVFRSMKTPIKFYGQPPLGDPEKLKAFATIVHFPDLRPERRVAQTAPYCIGQHRLYMMLLECGHFVVRHILSSHWRCQKCKLGT